MDWTTAHLINGTEQATQSLTVPSINTAQHFRSSEAADVSHLLCQKECHKNVDAEQNRQLGNFYYTAGKAVAGGAGENTAAYAGG